MFRSPLTAPDLGGQFKLALLMPAQTNTSALDGFETGRCIAISESSATSTASAPQWHVVDWAGGRSLTELYGQSAVLRFEIAGPLFAFTLVFEDQQG